MNPSGATTDTGQRLVSRQYTALGHTHVSIDDAFWAPRIATNRAHTIAHIHRQLQRVGSIDAFRPGWEWPDEATQRGRWGGTATLFWDSDVGKWIEAASYSLATHPDPELDALLEQIITIIAGAQQPDGYLNTWFTYVDPEKRWKNLRDWHELYCAGHLIEAAVAHFEATGKRSLLDILCRYADHIDRTFGAEPDKARGYCGHPEIELALIRLARATGEQRYLDLSRYFVDERGRQPHYFDAEARARGDDPAAFWAGTYMYNQSHVPVREQTEVVGHAVRAVYLYSAMADLAGIDGDAELMSACERLWTHLTTTRMYVTGGIGTSGANEGFTGDYDLPNESAYAETCAAIGLVFWAQRMLQLDCNRRYADIMELALYNSVLSSVTFDGEAFFYENPLESSGGYHREPWFRCPCCPPNLSRLLASLGQYVYGFSTSEILVHLYMQSSGSFRIGDQIVTVRQQTNYPWNGAVRIQVDPEQPAHFSLRLRIPGWCATAQAMLNGVPLDAQATHEGGYLRVEREWRPGDVVELDLPMAIRQIHAHPDVAADIGRVALKRGPLVYCLERIDHEDPIGRILLDERTELTAQLEPDLLQGVIVLDGETAALNAAEWESILYRDEPATTRPCTLRAIPYYAWDNREAGAMRVWLPVR